MRLFFFFFTCGPNQQVKVAVPILAKKRDQMVSPHWLYSIFGLNRQGIALAIYFKQNLLCSRHQSTKQRLLMTFDKPLHRLSTLSLSCSVVHTTALVGR